MFSFLFRYLFSRDVASVYSNDDLTELENVFRAFDINFDAFKNIDKIIDKTFNCKSVDKNVDNNLDKNIENNVEEFSDDFIVVHDDSQVQTISLNLLKKCKMSKCQSS